MAVASQKMMLIKFLERIRGARIAAPTSEVPVIQMPQAAPSTEIAMVRPWPMQPKRYGLIPFAVSHLAYSWQAAIWFASPSYRANCFRASAPAIQCSGEREREREGQTTTAVC
eukprot:SAG22_NODE_122_length_18920_cov_23.494076_16_plen_113_part_00